MMDSTWMPKQLVDFQKSIFENTFSALVMIQDNTEKVAKTLVEQATWFPEENKRFIGQWTDTYKKSRTELKDTIVDNFDNMTKIFNS